MRLKNKALLTYSGLYLLCCTTPCLADFKECRLHEPCNMPGTCQCVVPANSYYDRAYYLDFVIKKNHFYKCKFSSFYPIKLDEQGSYIPPNTSYWCESCPLFSTKINFDTSQMKTEIDTMKIRYVVGASDIPCSIEAICQE